MRAQCVCVRVATPNPKRLPLAGAHSEHARAVRQAAALPAASTLLRATAGIAALLLSAGRQAWAAAHAACVA